LLHVPGVVQSPIAAGADLFEFFVEQEWLVETAKTGLDTYGAITSPSGKKNPLVVPRFTGGSTSVWDAIAHPVSSPEVADNRAFCGNWKMLTLALWGRSVEIMVNQFTNFDANLVKISATLLGDVAAGCWPLSQLVIRSRHRVAP
jgi:hypothetical protein